MRLLLVALLSLSCRRDPTWSTVEPILARRCLRCHAANAPIAPPPLGTYQQAAANAGLISRAVQTRESYLVDTADALRPEWIRGKRTIGVTAGASAPEVLVQEVIFRLQQLGAKRVHEIEGIEENVTFPLPKSISQG